MMQGGLPSFILYPFCRALSSPASSVVISVIQCVQRRV
jgi:hypothetical protein